MNRDEIAVRLLCAWVSHGGVLPVPVSALRAVIEAADELMKLLRQTAPPAKRPPPTPMPGGGHA